MYVCMHICMYVFMYPLDDRKISILKWGIGIESEKYPNKLEIKNV